jgi:hypothetical protein
MLVSVTLTWIVLGRVDWYACLVAHPLLEGNLGRDELDGYHDRVTRDSCLVQNRVGTSQWVGAGGRTGDYCRQILTAIWRKCRIIKALKSGHQGTQ